MGQYVNDFQWQESETNVYGMPQVTIGIGESYQLHYSYSSNTLGEDFFDPNVGSWVYYESNSSSFYVVNTPECFSIDSYGKVTGIKEGWGALKPTGNIRKTPDTDRCFIKVISSGNELESNNTFETANLLKGYPLSFDLYNITDVDYFKVYANAGDKLTFKVTFDNPDNNSFGFRWASFNPSLQQMNGGDLPIRENEFVKEYSPEWTSFVGSGYWYFQVYYDQSRSQYFSSNGMKIQAFINDKPAIPSTTYRFSITSLGNGCATFNGFPIRSGSQSFTLNEGTNATITFTPDDGYKIGSVKVNNTDVASKVSDNQYTISNITENTSVVVTFEANSTSGIELNSTNFPDANFRNWILNNISGASDGWLTDAEIARVAYIDCSSKSIASLKGIEFFTALTKLDCNSNQLRTLDVSKNTALTSLYCRGNQLTSLDVSKNTALTYLNCGGNQLTSLDVSKNTALTSLYCFGNQLTNLDVSKNTALTYLYCFGNRLTNLDVSKNTVLTYLYCYINQLTSLDVSKNTALTDLSCGENELTNLDVSMNTALTSLSCGENQLTNLDVSKNTTLTELVCYSNQLMTLDLSFNNFTNPLTSISPQALSLTAVDISAGIAIPVPSEFNLSNVSNLKLDGTSVSGNVTTINSQKYLVFAQTGTAQSSIDGKKLTYDYNTGNSFSAAASMDVTITMSYSATTYTLSIQSGNGGYVSYNGTTIMNTIKSFSVTSGSSATITITPNSGYRLSKLMMNNTDVTSKVSNNQYTVSNIKVNTTVKVAFTENEYSSLTYDGVNYRVVSNSSKTVSVANGSYGYSLTIQPSFILNGFGWNVTGIDSDVLSNNPQLAAIIWNPAVQFSASVNNPNFLLYVTSSQYAPSSIKNVVVGNTANSITLTDASSGNNFYCPREFTARSISYSHSYGMTTGINEARGWESIVLPFDVEAITHTSKGNLVPFSRWQEGGSTKPFWLYQLGSTGFAEANSIKANTPYIISMPNNAEYKDEYRVAGTITFSSTDVTVKSSESLENGSYSDRTFVPNFINHDANSGFYVLNAANSYVTNTSSYAEGSRFIKNLRAVHPFEAYIASANNAKESFPIFEDTPTWIQLIENSKLIMDRVYNLSGQQVKIEGDHNYGSLKKGIYIVNGKKKVIR